MYFTDGRFMDLILLLLLIRHNDLSLRVLGRLINHLYHRGGLLLKCEQV